MSSGKWRPFCLGLNVLNTVNVYMIQCNSESQSYYMLSFIIAGERRKNHVCAKRAKYKLEYGIRIWFRNQNGYQFFPA